MDGIDDQMEDVKDNNSNISYLNTNIKKEFDSYENEDD